jgi:hypothetical protein
LGIIVRQRSLVLSQNSLCANASTDEHSYTDCDSDGNTYGYIHSNSNSDSNGYIHSNSNSDSNGYLHTESYRDSYTHSDYTDS